MKSTLERYEQTRSQLQSQESGLTELRDLPAVTRDGTQIHLYGNIEFPHEATHCLECGAEGVGLYRTEFLYLGKDKDPTEAEHLEAYMTVLAALGCTGRSSFARSIWGRTSSCRPPKQAIPSAIRSWDCEVYACVCGI